MALPGEYERQEFEDVEIRIFREPDGLYTAELNLPDDSRIYSPLPDLPLEALHQAPDAHDYGVQLFDWLFSDVQANVSFRRARRLAQLGRAIGPSSIRLRLSLEPEAQALHGLWWESLCDPRDDDLLSLTTAFSRFQRVRAPRSWPISERPLRMLLVAAGPEEAGDADPTSEQEVVERILHNVGDLAELVILRDRPRFGEFLDQMQRGCHVLHLEAQARCEGDQGFLLLPSDDGQMTKMPYETIVDAISSLESTPYLVFLATAWAAGEKGIEPQRHLAPMLVEAGVQAVVAIQAHMRAEFRERFVARFYELLLQTGSIDLAVSMARASLQDPESQQEDRPAWSHWDWVHPVLYMRTPDALLFQPQPREWGTKFVLKGSALKT